MNENKEYLDLQGEQTITCYKMNYITETIIYVVAESQEDLSKQLFVITYINGEVKVTPVTENSVHSEHNDFIFNKNIIHCYSKVLALYIIFSVIFLLAFLVWL